MKTKLVILFVFATFLFLMFFSYVYITNPYQTSFFGNPYLAREENNKIVVDKKADLAVVNNPITELFAYAKSGIHIFTNTYFGSKKAASTTWEKIISDIHTLRFDTKWPYIISGDHFSVFYPRSLGVFYQTALDPRVAMSEGDWTRKQAMYAQTTAFALEAFTKLGDVTTTVVPVGRHTVTGINVYAYPSDTVYSLLYALQVMQNEKELETLYPFEAKSVYPLQTQTASTTLVKTYKPSLGKLYKKYRQTVFDEKTGLIKESIHLSGTKDITKRTGAFYDNVIFWRTTQLAQTLGVIPADEQFLIDLKSRIIKTYWYDKGGYFLEDLSENSRKNHYYSSDWLVAMMTGFLSLRNPDELPYLEKSVAYIRKQQLDKPFPLRYQHDDRSQRQYPVVKFFIPAYGGTIIWSHWGIEYIKLLLMLGNETNNEELLNEAKGYLEQYKKNIATYRGYPEVYNTDGTMVQGLIYTSVRQTGWVVNFEQALAMANAYAQ